MAQGDGGRDSDLDTLRGLAERMGLEGDQAENFVNGSMKRLGYVPRMDWDEPEDDNNGGDDDFFGERRKNRQQRSVGGKQQQRGGRGDKNDWQYG